MQRKVLDPKGDAQTNRITHQSYALGPQRNADLPLQIVLPKTAQCEEP